MHRKKRLIATISLILVAGFLTTSLISYYIARASMYEQIVSSSLPLTSDNIYSEIQRDLIPPVFISSLMAQNTFLKDWMLEGEEDEGEITRYLNEIKDRYNTFTCFLVSDKTRKYYSFKGVLKEVSPEVEADDWYFRVRAMDEVYETNIDPDLANTNSMTIFINYKVFDHAGEFLGATGVGLKVSALIDLMKHYGQKYHRNVYLMNKTGDVVLSSHEGQAHIDAIDGMASIQGEVLSEAGGAFQYKRDGEHVFLNSRFIKELNWHLLVEETAGAATERISTVLMVNLAICGGITLLIILITLFSINLYEKSSRQQLETIDEQHLQIKENNRKLIMADGKKNQLLHLLCHDLSHPFGALISSLNIIEEDPAALNELLPHIKDALKTGMGTIEMVRKMRVVDEGKVDLFIKSYPLKPLIQESAILLKDKLESKDIKLNIDVDEQLTVSVEEILFCNSILSNLLSNAVKFSERNAEVGLTARSVESGKVKLTITDQGVGMPDSILKNLFDLKQSTTRPGTEGEGGSGFGMLLVQQFITAFDGTIEVHSKEIGEFPQDHGTEVILTLNP